MTGGRGWIAVALVVFARWAPWPALLGALLFGCIEAVIPHIAAAGIRVPQYLMMMTPYVATIAVMMWVGATHAAIGRAGGARSAACAGRTAITHSAAGFGFARLCAKEEVNFSWSVIVYAHSRLRKTARSHGIFEDYLDPAKTAVVSIDMHRGHLDPSPDCPCPAPRARDIVAPIDAFHDQRSRARHSDHPCALGSAARRRRRYSTASASAWRRTFPLHVGEIPNSDAHAIEGSPWTEFVTRVAPDDLIVETKKSPVGILSDRSGFPAAQHARGNASSLTAVSPIAAF